MSRYLALYRCPHGIPAIMLADQDGHGVRLTRLKCCGQWHMVERVPFSADAMRDAIEEFSAAIDEIES